MAARKEFEQAIKEKKVPVLVLDQKWHRLFAIHGKTDEISDCEKQVNDLLAEQGRENQKLKDLKKAKNQLMDGIVSDMDSEDDIKVREKKNEERKRLIDELNEQIDACEDRLLAIPKELKESNEHLMLLSMDYFYEKLQVNKKESDEIEAWINNIRVELKKNIIRKQNRDINNHEIYGYLHDVLGPEILDLFDFHFEEEQKQKEEAAE